VTNSGTTRRRLFQAPLPALAGLSLRSQIPKRPIKPVRSLTLIAWWPRIFILILLLLIANTSTSKPLAQAPRLAPTPPMGWNSWDAYGTTVTEADVKANADVMASGLKQFGWQYIVIDIQWYEPFAKAHGYRPNARLQMDEYGRLIPAVNRFPSSANGQGFKPLADYVHSKGLKFGIHILRGIPRQAVEENLSIFGSDMKAADIADKKNTCAWNTDLYGVDMTKPGAQAYYDSIVAQYAKWGVDFIKADDMGRPYPDLRLWMRLKIFAQMRKCGALRTIFGTTGARSRTCTSGLSLGRRWWYRVTGLTLTCSRWVVLESEPSAEMIDFPSYRTTNRER
jgi:hypothetical protein